MGLSFFRTHNEKTENNNEPNKALEPTTMPVTFRANARNAPVIVAAEL